MKKLYNKIKVAVLVLLATVSLNSCEDWLELYPEGETLLEDFWKTADDIESVLASCYLTLMNSSYTDRAFVWGELRSDNMEQGAKASPELIDILDVNIQTTNSYCNWAIFYESINYCNTVIHYAPQVLEEDENLSVSRMESYRSEARAIRALSYFYLVRAFGNVPLVWKPTIDDSESFDIAASPGDSVLAVVTEDLREALVYAHSTFGSSRPDYNVCRFTKQSIRALLADILLWQGRYQECVDVCDEFIANNNSNRFLTMPGKSHYYLLDHEEWLTSFSTNPYSVGEVIFAAGCAASNVESSVSNLFGHQVKDIQIGGAESLCDPNNHNYSILFENGDARKDYLRGMPAQTGERRDYSVTKYLVSNIIKQGEQITYNINTSKFNQDFIFYRLPDIYLMRAEALVELAAQQTPGSSEEESCMKKAIEMVNETFMRSNTTRGRLDTLNLINFSDVDHLRELVLNERRREFAYEGKRWFDLVRYAKRTNDVGYVESCLEDKRFPNSASSVALSKMSTMDALYMPYFETEIINNKLLVQNPFYKTDETTEKN